MNVRPLPGVAEGCCPRAASLAVRRSARSPRERPARRHSGRSVTAESHVGRRQLLLWPSTTGKSEWLSTPPTAVASECDSLARRWCSRHRRLRRDSSRGSEISRPRTSSPGRVSGSGGAAHPLDRGGLAEGVLCWPISTGPASPGRGDPCRLARVLSRSRGGRSLAPPAPGSAVSARRRRAWACPRPRAARPPPGSAAPATARAGDLRGEPCQAPPSSGRRPTSWRLPGFSPPPRCPRTLAI